MPRIIAAGFAMPADHHIVAYNPIPSAASTCGNHRTIRAYAEGVCQ